MVPQRIGLFLLIFRIIFPCVKSASFSSYSSPSSSSYSSFIPSVIINNQPVSFRDSANESSGKSKEFFDTTRHKLNLFMLKTNITQQKSNIYRPTSFITNDRFKHGLITKDSFKWYFPKESHIVQNSINTVASTMIPNWNENSQHFYDSYMPFYSSTSTTTERPQDSYLSVVTSPAPPTIHYNDDIVDDGTQFAENTFTDTYNNEDDELQYSIVPIHTTPATQDTPSSLTFALSSPTPATIVIASSSSLSSSTSSTNNHNKRYNGNKKDKKKKKKKFTASPQIHRHFIENLDYYRKILQINCTGNLAKNDTQLDSSLSSISSTVFSDNGGTVLVTPKPNRVNHNDKYAYDKGQKDKNDHKGGKKKCNCTKHNVDDDHHGHHYHHHHHNKDPKESHEHKPVSYTKPQQVMQFQTPEAITNNHLQNEASSVVTQIFPIKASSTPIRKRPTAYVLTSHRPEKNEYFDTSLKHQLGGEEEYEEMGGDGGGGSNGGMFHSIYKVIQNAFSTSNEDQETVDYDSKDFESEETEEIESEGVEAENDDDSEEEEEDESDEDYNKKRRKRDLLMRKNAAVKLETKSKKKRTKNRARNETKTTPITTHSATTKATLLSTKATSTSDSSESEEELSSMPEKFFDVLSNLFGVERSDKKKESKSLSDNAKYTNHQLWRLFLKSKKNVAHMQKFIKTAEGRKFHWLTAPRVKNSMDVVIPAELSKSFRNYLDEGEIHSTVEIYNIYHAMKLENPRLMRRTDGIKGRQLPVQYYTVSDHYTYYKLLKQNYPNFLELIEIGRSSNNLPLVIAKISSRTTRKKTRYEAKKPAIFIQSGNSPHLWLHVASSNFILKNLLMHISNGESFGNAIRKFDWYIFGIANPDGYEYSINYDRLWQKTRSQHDPLSSSSPISGSKSNNIMMSTFSWFIENSPQEPTNKCYGVHYSRNFDSHWKRNKALSDNNQCSEFYTGAFPSSEPEVKSLSDFLIRHQDTIQLFINLEGYGKKILFPTLDLSEDDINDLNDLARAGLRNIKMHRSADNKYGISKNDTEIAIGTPESFALYKTKIKYAYRIEGCGETLHQSIFVPIKSIEKIASEILDIIKGMVKYLENE